MTRIIPWRGFQHVSPNVCLNFDGSLPRSPPPPQPQPPPPPAAFSVQISVAGQQWELKLMRRVVQHTTCLCQSSSSDGGMHPHARGHVRKHQRQHTPTRFNTRSSWSLKQTGQTEMQLAILYINASIPALIDGQSA